MKVKKLFNEAKEKYGSIFWDDVELAITQDPYPFGPFEDWFLRASAMDKAGNLWYVVWLSKPDVDECDGYDVRIIDWDKPCRAQMIDVGYYLDD